MRIIILFAIVLAGCDNQTRQKDIVVTQNDTLIMPGKTYAQELRYIESVRNQFSEEYRKSDTNLQNEILNKSADFLYNEIFNNIYGFWKGTPWDFNGTTTVPGTGFIACGYFVTTVLEDAGMHINRVNLAIGPSLTMMKKLTGGKTENKSLLNVEAFYLWMKNQSKGIYIAGLDFHTGFIVNDGSECWFLHSDYINRRGVIKEKLNESYAFRASKTRYIACLTTNTFFLRSWLLH